MRIIDLAPENLDDFCLCLEEWSDEMKEAGDHKRRWVEKHGERGLRVKLAVDDCGPAAGTVGGMIQYLPIEHSPASGEGLYFILCVWVHGYREGRGNFQKKGMGRALLQAAEDDARALGAKGMAAWGVALPFWMRASWFKKHGYRQADRSGIRALLWKPFRAEARAPAWIRPKKKPRAESGKVVVTGLLNGWCPAMSLVHERARRAAAELGEGVEFREVRTDDRAVFLEWGIGDAVFVDGREIRSGPPPKYEKIKKKISRRLKKL
ncbi:MAG: GNAT family N-acetyltransferase [Candidatus Aminicenantes bacterium]|nr:GNAT family N-acetyltransferase [Candidatus Aminicenantes bacterium]